MKLYVANTSQQIHIFAYRIPEHPQPRFMNIPQGGQVALSGPPEGFSQPQVDYIIKHHGQYGMRNVADAEGAREVVPLIYSVDRPVPLVKIQRVISRNHDFLARRGAVERKDAAIGIDQAYTRLNREAEIKQPEAVEVSVEEQESKGNPNPTLHEVLTVARSGEDKGPSPSRRRRAAAA